jgi:hypothetical protein
MGQKTSHATVPLNHTAFYSTITFKNIGVLARHFFFVYFYKYSSIDKAMLHRISVQMKSGRFKPGLRIWIRDLFPVMDQEITDQEFTDQCDSLPID